MASLRTKRELALTVVCSEIQEAQAELREHEQHVQDALMRLQRLNLIREALEASPTPETRT